MNKEKLEQVKKEVSIQVETAKKHLDKPTGNELEKALMFQFLMIFALMKDLIVAIEE